jgi:RNA polymerase sigma-70 factor (ECF subfamily)
VLIYAAVMTDTPPERAAIDETLLLRIGQGDREAFETLYRQLSGAVYGYALSILRSHSDAEDVMQDTFLKIRAAAHLYRPMGRPGAWIFTIARNLCLMRFRQRRRQEMMRPEEGQKALSFDHVADRADRLALEAAFTVLTEEESRIVLLHAVAGMKHREVARTLDLPLSTVLSKYQRSIRKLRAELEGGDGI